MFTVRSPTTESRKCTKEVGSYLKINVQLLWRPCSSSSVTRINQLNVGSGSGSGSVWGARPAASSRSTVAQQSVTAALPVGMLPSRKNVSFRTMSDGSINEALVDKIRQYAVKPSDYTEQLRSAAAKLHSRAASQDKLVREITLERIRRKKADLLSLLLNLLESVRDHITAASIAGIIHECISPKSGSSRSSAVRRLVDYNATNIIVKMVIQLPTCHTSESLLQELVLILGQLAQKDMKFSLKVRLLNGVKTFHYLLRVHYHTHNKMLQPILIIMKTLARNANTTAILVKDGISSTMEKSLIHIGFSPNIRLRLLLNVFNYLSKNNRFCVRLVKAGTVQLLMKMFERWERYDGKMRYKICSYTLLTLQHVCTTKAGRTAVRSCNGQNILYKFCLWCPDEKVYDTLLSRVCTIISLCIEKKELPVASEQSPAQFQLPDKNVSTEIEIESDDSGEESGDDEGDEEKEDKEVNSQVTNLPQRPQRELEDLKMYANFWCELPVNQKVSSPNTAIANANHFPISDASISAQFLSRYHLYDGENQYNIPSFNNRLAGDEKNVKATSRNTQPLISCSFGNRSGYNLSIINKIQLGRNRRTVYCEIASSVNSIVPFVKVAYPDMVGSESTMKLEPLNHKERKTCRSKMMTCLDRGLKPEHMANVVYDLDSLLTNNKFEKISTLTNSDEERLGFREPNLVHLCFESRFESGNLRKVIQVGPREYDLILMPDVNSKEHCTWFYFEVSNMDANIPYVFNIINCEKANSQFNYGMKPLLYSVQEAVSKNRGWVREGSDICYFRNAYPCSGKKQKKRTYLTATFTIKFPHSLDVCYLAYHYPYTYSQLLTNIWCWKQSLISNIVLRAENLCLSLNNNETPVLTISAPDTYNNKVADREIIFLTARVHPGESNSSWVMHGTLQYLFEDTLSAVRARMKYVFKVVPMLNPEGVINGCYRCGLTNEDLNRRWSQPNPDLHPVIYHTKGLMDYCVRILKKVPYVFCDYHGHSRRKNVFLYGCSSEESWLDDDRNKIEEPLDFLMLPNLMSSLTPGFSLPLCKFSFERHKEATARVTVWREFSVKRSYTMECSYCGCDMGPNKGNHLNTNQLKEIGNTFGFSLSCLYEETQWRSNIIVANQDTDRGHTTDKESSNKEGQESSDSGESSDDGY